MRNRLEAIILLVGWIGQLMVCIAGGTVELQEGCPVVWPPNENLAELVSYQVSRLMPWPPPRTCSRHRVERRGGKGTHPSRSRPLKGDEEGDEHTHPSRSCLLNEEQSESAESSAEVSLVSVSPLNARRWGLSPALVRELPQRLHSFWRRYYKCFETKTRNAGEYAYHYLSALFRMETERNYTNIGNTTGVSGENVQHFMSNSPWPKGAIPEQVQEEIKATPGLAEGSVLLLDESADEKAGDKSAGAARQHNGRLGKVEMSQVGVFLGYANVTRPECPMWTWVDGELYLPEYWFSPEMADERERTGIPEERQFATKIELGWKMIQRAQANGLPFEALACDDLYGRSTWLRDNLAEAEIIYMADVPRTTHVYLERPVLGVPETKPGHRGRKPTRLQVLNGVEPVKVYQVARSTDTTWTQVRVRPVERGELNDPFAVRRVWTLRDGQSEPVEELLVIRRETNNRHTYSLSNAPADSSIEYLAWLKCQRYFVERANQDAKSEAGWDELRARKYRGWEHHLALVIMAVWFVAQVKWEWAQRYVRDPALARQLAVEVLLPLSMANIRVLFRAAMPLPQLTPEEAVVRVVEYLVNRTRSRASRLNHQRAALNANAPP